MFYTYVIENLKGRRYTGSTEDLNDRLKMHNDVSVEKSRFHCTTFKKGPWSIIYKKVFSTRNEALKFEKFLKTGKGREWIERVRLGE